MTKSRWIIVVLAFCIFTFVSFLSGVEIPKPLKTRFVVGDPVWRELPIRAELKSSTDKVWQLCINTILENNFDIATMEKESGYIRTTWNEGVVVLGGKWFYRVQVSIKLVPDGDLQLKNNVLKVRLQVTGEISKSGKGGISAYFRGYDQVVLQNLFQDLQSKLGSI